MGYVLCVIAGAAREGPLVVSTGRSWCGSWSGPTAAVCADGAGGGGEEGAIGGRPARAGGEAGERKRAPVPARARVVRPSCMLWRCAQLGEGRSRRHRRSRIGAAHSRRGAGGQRATLGERTGSGQAALRHSLGERRADVARRKKRTAGLRVEHGACRLRRAAAATLTWPTQLFLTPGRRWGRRRGLIRPHCAEHAP